MFLELLHSPLYLTSKAGVRMQAGLFVLQYLARALSGLCGNATLHNTEHYVQWFCFPAFQTDEENEL